MTKKSAIVSLLGVALVFGGWTVAIFARISYTERRRVIDIVYEEAALNYAHCTRSLVDGEVATQKAEECYIRLRTGIAGRFDGKLGVTRASRLQVFGGFSIIVGVLILVFAFQNRKISSPHSQNVN